MLVEKFYPIYQKSNGLSTDSRTISEGQIFLALQGPRFDGHEYVQGLQDKGIACAIIDNPDYTVDGFTVLVADSLDFLQQLARHHRRQLRVPVLGITGSNGKTTTKELIYAVLAQKYNVHATKGNLNNHIGVPLTLLEADHTHDFLIIEMGANKAGDIEELSNIALPDYGLITNIGAAHLEGFGSMEGVLQGKTELYRYLRGCGDLIFYNADDPVLSAQIKITDKSVAYRPSEINFVQDGMYLKYEVEGNWVSTHMYGSYNATNIATALAVGRYFEVNADAMHTAIAAYIPKMNRSEIIKRGSTSFVLDAYNANPTSMKSSLDAFAKLETSKDKIVIMGDMFELGRDSQKLHKEVLAYAAQYTWDKIILVGKIFSSLQPNFDGHYFDDVSSLRSHPDIKEWLSNKICLIKGSRSMRLEELIDNYN